MPYTSSAREQYVGLDWLRFGLAAYLILFHTLRRAPWLGDTIWPQFIAAGYFATSTFFVLSGFILAHIYINQDGALRGSGARGFWINRISSLYLIHILSMLLAIGMHLPQLIIENGYQPAHIHNPEEARALGAQKITYLSIGETSANLLLHLALLQAWNPFYLIFNIPSWTLSDLAFFYFVFPWVAPALWRARNKYAALACLGCLYVSIPAVFLAMGWNGVAATGILYHNPLVRLPEFMAGILFYFALQQSPGMLAWLARYRRIGMFAALAITVTVAFRYSRPSTAELYLLHNGALLPLQLMLIAFASVCCTHAPPTHARVARMFGASALVIFGIHYPLYWLSRVLSAFVSSFPEVMEASAREGILIVERAARVQFLSSAEYLVYLVAAIALSVLLSERLMQPARWRIRKYLHNRLNKAVPVPAV